MGRPNVGCRIDETLFAKFKRKCRREGKQYADVIIPAIKEFVAGKHIESIQNDYITELETENDNLKAKITKLSDIKNSMNVNNPENFARIQKLIKHLWNKFARELRTNPDFDDKDFELYSMLAYYRLDNL